ncbi:MAG: hypothetical protein GXC73_18515 [Chitinophagaceae bacterium]|nr:hypothetical protein [Chitinophagaceae bacterium]
MEKQLKKGKALDTKDKSKMLRLWILFAIIAIVLGIIGWFVPFVWALSGLAWLASVIFFVLWLIALAA